jgi:hypothetical protein
MLPSYISISVHSPVDLRITDSSGAMVYVGKDNQEVGFEAYVAVIEEEKLCVVPNPGQLVFKIEVIGTGDGNYALEISDEQGNQRTETGSIRTGENQQYTAARSQDGLLIQRASDFIAYQTALILMTLVLGLAAGVVFIYAKRIAPTRRKRWGSCAACGTPLRKDSRFCLKCGRQVGKDKGGPEHSLGVTNHGN